VLIGMIHLLDLTFRDIDNRRDSGRQPENQQTDHLLLFTTAISRNSC